MSLKHVFYDPYHILAHIIRNHNTNILGPSEVIGKFLIRSARRSLPLVESATFLALELPLNTGPLGLMTPHLPQLFLLHFFCIGHQMGQVHVTNQHGGPTLLTQQVGNTHHKFVHHRP